MRIASYNAENFFARAKALNRASWTVGQPALAAQAELNSLFGNDEYSAANKRQMVKLLGILGLDRTDLADLAVLRQVRGRLLRRHVGSVEIVAGGRSDWTGWVELTTEPVQEVPVNNTGRVISDVNADVLGVVEAENRVVLRQFADAEIRDRNHPRYQHVMLVDGNDDRGIDVAILTRKNWPLHNIRSHVDDVDTQGVVFSRDCPEYHVTTPGGNTLVVLINHFKSKGYGRPIYNDARRHRQARRVAAIYSGLRESGLKHIAVIGDFNDTPVSKPLRPLFAGTDLRDISCVAGFDDGGRPGTIGNCTASERIDYILLSPALFAKATGGGIFRLGAWGGKNGTLWPHYDTLTQAADAASDHSAIYGDLDLP